MPAPGFYGKILKAGNARSVAVAVVNVTKHMRRFKNEDDEAEWADRAIDDMRSSDNYKPAYERYLERSAQREHLLEQIKEPNKVDLIFGWLVLKVFGMLSWLLRIPCLWILLAFSLLLAVVVALVQVWRMIYGL